MNWHEKLQMIIDYVENHLQRKEEPIDNDEIARIAGCSFGFFQKIFSYMNGISFSEYVRLRKLTLAGYDSPTSFTKAFTHFHGVCPSKARNFDIELKVYPKMQIFKSQRYTWRIEQKSSFRLIGKGVKVSCIDNVHYLKIPEFWNNCQRDGVFSRLISMDHNKPKGLFGVFGAFDERTMEIEYAIMTISNQELPPDFMEIIIPETTWVIFDCKGAVGNT